MIRARACSHPRSYGIDCTEDCSSANAVASSASHHRRAQGGSTAAVQVQAGKSSGDKLTTILNCLAKGRSVTACTANSPTVGS